MLTPSLLALSLATSTPGCVPASGDAATVLRRAADVVGMTRVGGRVLQQHAADIVQLDYESDRTFPPYIVQASRFDEWFDPASGADRSSPAETLAGASEFTFPATISGSTATYVVRDTALIGSEELYAQSYATRPLNAWAVLADWLAAGDVRVVERCQYRDYPRLVLSRRGAQGVERLYIDSKSGYPAALIRTEPHYLWGQTRVEYIYSTWTRVGAEAHVPGTAARMVDGSVEITRSFGSSKLIPRDSAPALVLPANRAPMSIATPAFLVPSRPDTIRVSATTFLLHNRGYTETVTLARDTVFVLDATQGDARARHDSAWISVLFPGRHPIAVVVTDLAWPHIAGVRYWVAQGATIVSHRAARPFLERIVARTWTDAPDLLETRRSRVGRMRFVAVDDSLRLAGGAITLFPIDGLSSEVALAAYIQRDRFLWASDFVQTLRAPTQYLDEVAAAVWRMGYTPERLAAEHLPLSPWEQAARLAEPRPPAG